ncbi:aldehyde dehydrogenase family protein [Paenarthrobacter nicotinovorans]|uniref:aldehyde dehydrogenase family protein n=1 Tax=Paenarthrobacter nicotinovorans TaxID=29320 RepID=UPI003D66F9E8
MSESEISFPSNDLVDLLAEYKFGHVIDGSVDLGGESRFTLVNPCTGKPFAQVPLGSSADVDRAVEAARRALPGWRRLTPSRRADHLLALASIIDEKRALFAQLESMNVGKPTVTSYAEIAGAAGTLRFMAGAIRTVQTPAADEYVEGFLSLVRREPLGVVGAITPWNFPLSTAIAKLAPALAAGNTVVLKPSELTPLTTALFADLARTVLPAGVLNVVLGTGPSVGKPLGSHPDVDVISMTGSVATGAALSKAGADTLKHLRFELGGKTPVIVFDDADLDQAVATVRTAAFYNCGQCCGAATRVLCQDSVQEEFVRRLREAVGSLRVGQPDEGHHIEVGPLVSQAQLEKVESLVQGAVSAGATVQAGGQRVSGTDGFFYEPTVLNNIPAGTAILQEEIFGPVVTIETFTDEAEAIALANNTDFGLVASVWTENTRRALRVIDELEQGTVEVNTALVAPVEMPFGGFGMSGLGYENSSYSIDDLSRKKHVVIAK